MQVDEIEVGDQVICVQGPRPSLVKYGYVEEVGDVFTVLDRDCNNLYLVGLNKDRNDNKGRSPCRFKLYKKKGADMFKFNVGDRVRLVSNTTSSRNKVGFIGYVRERDYSNHSGKVEYRVAESLSEDSDYANWSHESDLVACPEVQYEDEWHLNTGAVEIPDDADKAWNSDKTSVVAFRYVKKPKVTTQVKYFHGNPGKYFTSGHEFGSSHTKVTFVFTDGELTDIQWEKL